MKKKYLIIHHNDLDGHGAGAVVYKYLTEIKGIPEEQIVLREASYEKTPGVPEVYDTIFMVDYSISETSIGWLFELLERGNKIIWIDHHKTSLETYKKYKAELDSRDISILLNENTESGAYATFKYLFPEKTIPTFISYIDDYDRWVHKYNDSMYFKCYMETRHTQPYDKVWNELFNSKNNTMFLRKRCDIGKDVYNFTIINNHMKYNDHGYYTYFGDFNVAVINEFGNSTLFPKEIFNSVDFVVRFHYNKEGTFTHSIYSKNPMIDCSILAELLGGGGHKGAAGFTSKKPIFKKEEHYTFFEKWFMKRLHDKFLTALNTSRNKFDREMEELIKDQISK